jgi:RHS repeat-associated protein
MAPQRNRTHPKKRDVPVPQSVGAPPTDGLNHLSGFSYDAAGNMLGDGLYTYTYNAEGLQVSTSASSQTYTYDGDGRRVKKSNGTTYWFSGVTGALLVETDASGNVLSQYIYLGGRRVARKDGSGNVFYYFEEPAGRTRTVTNASGVACNEADYYLFGGEQTHGNTCNQNYHFAGMYRDSETGNDATQFRMYESNLGRWMSPDPLGGDVTNPQSLNRYTYVLNNPVNLIDPLGLECTDVDSNGVMHCTIHAGSDDANTADDTVYVGTLDNIIDLINHGPSPFDSHPGGTRGGRPKRSKPTRTCVGQARVLAGNPKKIGQVGGVPPVEVEAGSAAADPKQWGFGSGVGFVGLPVSGKTGVPIKAPSAWIYFPNLNLRPNGPQQSFSGITDVIGGKHPPEYTDVRAYLKAKFPGSLLLELVTGQDQMVTTVELTLPSGQGCPAGTTDESNLQIHPTPFD